MSAVDFSEWATPPLELTLHGREYVVQPPSVDDSRLLLAAAVRAEVNLGLVNGKVPDEVTEILKSIKPGDHPALGPVFQQMVHDGIDQVTIDRFAYYATFYWARGREYASTLAAILWTPREITSGAGERPGPKAR